jgi:hypothetical protein
MEKLPIPPPWEEGMRLQPFFSEANVVTRSGLGLMRLEAEVFNEAVDSLSELPKARAPLRPPASACARGGTRAKASPRRA